ncbi:protein shifted isoform X3 [Monomorium pharaonis]|uniref:protein shifted isoform X3 n=1 Tax=Monomorium pharaonis TaxID=307658 RepID=UPI0017460649|nr:protein shifted isoform X3 [Monomorium pharaonis]
MRSAAATLAALVAALVLGLLDVPALARHQHRSENPGHKPSGDISLWIDQQQIKMFSGLAMEIYAISEGQVLPLLLDPEFESKLPMIPSEVSHVNFTWKSGVKKYYYNFCLLKSYDESILQTPSITIKTQGRVPKKPKEFSVQLNCAGKSGIAYFEIRLVIETRKRKSLEGTPLGLKLRKECTVREPNSGPCPDGYLGPNCKTALCYPSCMNGGNCTAPGVCSCAPGFHGPYCEGVSGICTSPCLNGGKCVRKDVCWCSRGFFGLRCEFCKYSRCVLLMLHIKCRNNFCPIFIISAKCVIPCLNGGKCRGNNICRCSEEYKGNHCEIANTHRTSQRSTCSKQTCKHGTCQPNDTCLCESGWHGKLCHKKNKKWA